MKLFGRKMFAAKITVPEALGAELASDEVVLGLATTHDGVQLAVTRIRLLIMDPAGSVTSLGWFEIAKARLESGILHVVPLRLVGSFAIEGDVVLDAPSLSFAVDRANRLTDQIHQRVRASVIGSRQLPWHGAGGWVTLRRVAGTDGVLPQLRLEPGADFAAPGFLAAAEQVVMELRGGGATTGTTGVDE